jgi:hypothetical protein
MGIERAVVKVSDGGGALVMCKLEARAEKVTLPPRIWAAFSVMLVLVISTLGKTGKSKPVPVPEPANSDTVRVMVPAVKRLPASTRLSSRAVPMEPLALPSVML